MAPLAGDGDELATGAAVEPPRSTSEQRVLVSNSSLDESSSATRSPFPAPDGGASVLNDPTAIDNDNLIGKDEARRRPNRLTWKISATYTATCSATRTCGDDDPTYKKTTGQAGGVVPPTAPAGYKVPEGLCVPGLDPTLVPGRRSSSGASAPLNSRTWRASVAKHVSACLLYTSPSPRDLSTSRMPSSA